MFILRQLGSTTLTGAQTDESATVDYRQQITDMNPRYVMALAGAGKFSSDFTQVVNGQTFTIPLPQNYTTSNMLHVVITSDQTLKLTTTSSVNPTSTVMIRAGLNQLGVICFCGAVSSMVINNTAAVTANLEWFLFELPAVTTVAGWRDGALATGTSTP